MIATFRHALNAAYRPSKYSELLAQLEEVSGTRIEFRVSETPVFFSKSLLDQIATAGAVLTQRLLAWPEYLAGAHASIPSAYRVAGENEHPHFLTADFALIRDSSDQFVPRLVEIQAFPSVFGYQELLARSYREVYHLPDSLGIFLSGLDRSGYWEQLRKTIVGGHDPENVVLTEVDPWRQKTLPDFLITSRKLGITVVDITTIESHGKKLHYRDNFGRLIPIHRIYNRAIADEMIVRQIRLPFDLTAPWDVEWAGHPNWYFLISKYSVPWLAGSGGVESAVVPPAVFLDDFLAGPGRDRLAETGVALPASNSPEAVYDDLLLKPLFSFAGKGIQFAPSRLELESIPEGERKNYLLQQRMHFVPTIETPHGLTQAEIRILYVWPDGGKLTPLIPLVRLGRGRMMGVDHNRDLEWVGASAAFWQ
ncbi:MAG TPA: hypothetical protein VIM62_02295 [Acidobacteriaceae bacterium]